MEQGTYEFEPHTSEVQVHVEGTDLGALFEEAGYALAEVMLGEEPPEPPPSMEEEDVTLDAADTEALLVDWLNELISRTDLRKRVYTHLTVDEIDERKLHARIRGFTPDVLKTAVKAATFHGVDIREHEDRFLATVVLDV
ncbi:archease [Pyxidicoccus parkwayensis]|uniref:Archease n=1 Tax=Pyxidicoccus parkwayensis TaxID=2813578 RepID=A0ABX7P824_9BACT|nr:archease [Pyxidicoccus parkwaysis]QSQ26664.1 archease [Pyxidicoccus parkwaysis]